MSDTAQQGYVTLAAQTAQGTPATTVTAGLLVTSSALSGQTENLLTDPEIGGSRSRDTDGVALGGFSASGALEGSARFERLGLLLLAAGFEEADDPVEDGSTGAFTHTFTPAETPTFLTVEGSWGTNRAVRRWTDVLVNELGLSVAGNDYAMMSADLLGIGESWQASPVTPVFVKPDPIGHFLGSAVELDGIGTFRFTETELTIAANLSDDEFVIGRRELVDITPGALEVSGTGVIRLDGAAPAQLTDLYRAAMYGDPAATSPTEGEPYHTSATWTFGSRRLVGTSTTLRYGVTVECPDVVVAAFPLEGSGADVVEASLELHAFDNGTAPIATITLVNARGTKYAAA
jgi:hypothetical protein